MCVGGEFAQQRALVPAFDRGGFTNFFTHHFFHERAAPHASHFVQSFCDPMVTLIEVTVEVLQVSQPFHEHADMG